MVAIPSMQPPPRHVSPHMVGESFYSKSNISGDLARQQELIGRLNHGDARYQKKDQPTDKHTDYLPIQMRSSTNFHGGNATPNFNTMAMKVEPNDESGTSLSTRIAAAEALLSLVNS